MTVPRPHLRSALSVILERLVCDEFELMESCQEAAADAVEEDRGRLLHQAGLCQVHLFDLESILVELGGHRASYSACVRRSLGRHSWRDSVEKISRRYERALGQPLPEELRQLLEANHHEHRGVAELAARRATIVTQERKAS